MKFAYLTASTAALLLSSTSLIAQETTSPSGAMDFTQSVFVDVEGAAYLIPIDLAAELCGADAASLTQTAQSAFDASGMDPSMMMGSGTDTAAAGMDMEATTADTASADAAAGADAAMTDTATADAGATAGTDAGAAAATDTATADAGATTGTEAGNVGAAGMGSDTATADAGAAAEGTTGDVQNVETTAADATAGAAGESQSFTDAGEEYLALVVCQVDAATANATGNTFAPATDAGMTE